MCAPCFDVLLSRNRAKTESVNGVVYAWKRNCSHSRGGPRLSGSRQAHVSNAQGAVAETGGSALPKPCASPGRHPFTSTLRPVRFGALFKVLRDRAAMLDMRLTGGIVMLPS